MRKIMSVVGTVALVGALAVPVSAGGNPTQRCNYPDPGNNGESGNFITISVKALGGHNIAETPPPSVKKAIICHYRGHDAANPRVDELVSWVV